MKSKYFIQLILIMGLLSSVFTGGQAAWVTPEAGQKITAENADQMVELARLGKGKIAQIAYTPDGTRLAAASSIGIYFYNLATKQELLVPTNKATCLAFSPDGKYLAVGQINGIVLIMDAENYKYVHLLAHYNRYAGRETDLVNTPTGDKTRDQYAPDIMSVAYSPDGRWLASSSSDWNGDGNTIILWDIQTTQVIRILNKPGTEHISRLAISPDGKSLAFGQVWGDIIVWDIESGSMRYSASLNGQFSGGLAFSPDGKTLAASTEKQGIWLMEAPTGRTQKQLSVQHLSDVLVFSPDGTSLVSGGPGMELVLWDIQSGQSKARVSTSPQAITGLAFSPDGSNLASSTWGGQISLRDPSSAALRQNLHGSDPCGENGFCGDITVAAISPDGHWAASELYLWDLTTGQISSRFNASFVYNAMTFSADSRFVAYSSMNQQGQVVVDLREVETGKTQQFMGIQQNGLSKVAISPDGQLLAGADDTPELIVWDTRTGKKLYTLEDLEVIGTVSGIVFSKDSRYMVLSKDLGEASLVFDAHTGEYLEEMDFPYMGVDAVLSPDGKFLACIVGEGIGLLYVTSMPDLNAEAAGQKSPGSAEKLDVDLDIPFDHYFEFSQPAISPDDELLAAGNQYGSVVLWDIQSQKVLRILQGHSDAVIRVKFTPDGDKLISVSRDGTVRIWGIPAQ